MYWKSWAETFRLMWLTAWHRWILRKGPGGQNAN